MKIGICALFISFIFFPFTQTNGKEIIVIPGLQLDFKNCKSFIVLENRVKMAKKVGDKKRQNEVYIPSGRCFNANPVCCNVRTEAEEMKLALTSKMGVSSSVIFKEEKSLTTRQNAKHTLNLISELFPNYKGLSVVTSFYHINRNSWLKDKKNNSTRHIFDKKFKNVTYYSSDRFLKPSVAYKDSFFTYSDGWRSDVHSRLFCDVNGDGMDDLVGIGSNDIDVSLSKGKSFKAHSSWGSQLTSSEGWNNIDHVRLCEDVNGDGKADLIGFGNDGVYISQSTGSNFEKAKKWSEKFGIKDGWNTKYHARMVGDVNGDGKADIVAVSDRETYVALSSGALFAPPQVWRKCDRSMSFKCGGFTGDHVRVLADFDGDGKKDIIGFGALNIFVMRSTGKFFEPSRTKLKNDEKGNKASFTPKAGGFIGGYRYNNKRTMTDFPRGAADFNGDGKADLWAIGKDSIMIAFSNGEEFEYLGSSSWSFHRRLKGYNLLTRDAGCFKCWDGWKHPRLAGDINGDGLNDIIGIGSKETYVTIFDLGGKSTKDQP